MKTILNLLPLTQEERAQFTAAAPDCRHLFRPVEQVTPRASSGTEADYAAAHVILGCPPEGRLACAGNLEWLQLWSAGADRYLAPGVLPAGVTLTTAVGAYGPAVSEHLLAMLLALYKRLPDYRDRQRSQLWADAGPAFSLLGQTVLVGGTGDIGVHFARLARALGAGRVLGLRRSGGRPAEGFDETCGLEALDRLLPQADAVALVLPHTPETAGLMTRARLLAMKPGAVLLNAGRGTAVDCAALAEVLHAGHLLGAGLDVTDPEPLPPGHPLWTAPGALITPHVAGGYGHMAVTLARIKALFLDNLSRYAQGLPLRNQAR